MIFNHVVSSRLRPTICLICICIPLVVFLIIYVVGTFRDVYKENNKVIEMKAVKFDEYLKTFNKSYQAEEYFKRLSYFKASLKEISRLNRLSGAVHGLTKFSDMSEGEFSSMFMTTRRPSNIGNFHSNCTNMKLTRINGTGRFKNSDDLPITVDWRKYNKIGPILNQKKCGACWAFGIAGLVESMALIQEIEKTYTRRSIQELIDCAEGNGCLGGSITDALEGLCTNHTPIVTEEEYPLVLVNNKCSLTYSAEGRRIKNFWYYENLNEQEMQYMLANYGPLAVVVNPAPWMHYIDGVIQRACSRSPYGTVTHIAQLVGYDKSTSVPYYIVRNSWGTNFGNGGYLKLVMYKNICGVSDEVTRLDVY